MIWHKGESNSHLGRGVTLPILHNLLFAGKYISTYRKSVKNFWLTRKWFLPAWGRPCLSVWGAEIDGAALTLQSAPCVDYTELFQGKFLALWPFSHFWSLQASKSPPVLYSKYIARSQFCYSIINSTSIFLAIFCLEFSVGWGGWAIQAPEADLTSETWGFYLLLNWSSYHSGPPEAENIFVNEETDVATAPP